MRRLHNVCSVVKYVHIECSLGEDSGEFQIAS